MVQAPSRNYACKNTLHLDLINVNPQSDGETVFLWLEMQENKEGTAQANGSYNAELKPESRKPRDVLRDMMIFYDTQAKDIIADIIIRLREDQQHARGCAADLKAMYNRFSEAAEIAIRCAEKLAPYEHPKLESIEVKKELTHRFVLRAPAPVVDITGWLENAKKEQSMLALKNRMEVEAEEPKPTFATAVAPELVPPKRPIVEDGDYPQEDDDGVYKDDDDEDEDL